MAQRWTRRNACANLTALLALLAACGEARDVRPAEVDRPFPQFDNLVYPVLVRDCGFDTCHGAEGRFLRVWGPGRPRLPSDDGVLPGAFDVPLGKEISTTFTLAKSMIDPRNPERSLLLRKPLAVEAGGAGHLGVDKWGRDVYRTTADEGYRVLRAWVVDAAPMEMEETMPAAP